MNDLIYVYESDFGPVRILVQESNEVYRDTESNKAVEKAKSSFLEAMSVVKAATNSINALIKDSNPDEVTVEFNLKVGGEAGFFAVCKLSSEADFKLTVKWINTKSDN